MTLDQVMRLSDAGFAAYQRQVAQLRAIRDDLYALCACGHPRPLETGPLRRYCSNACRQQAYRARKAPQ